MIKYIHFFNCIFLFALATAAQPVPVRLGTDDYSIQLPEGRTTFHVNESKVMIRFKEKHSQEELSAFFAGKGWFKAFEASWVLPFPDGIIAEFDPAAAEMPGYTERLDVLQQDDAVSFAAPVLVYNNRVQQAVYDLFYVRMAQPSQLALLQQQAAQLGFTIEKEYADRIYFCRVNKHSAGNAFEIARYLQSLRMVEFAEPDFIYWGKTETNDPFYAQQWHLNNTGTQFSNSIAGADLDMVNAWTLSTGIPQIKVAILDCFGSMAQFTHNDFSFQAAYDATGTGFTSSGYQGDAHGINCGGLIGAATNNNIGVAGIAYNAKVYAVKIGTIINSSGNWNATGNSISDGITWAYQNAHIVSNSNSLGSSSSLINNAITNCITNGRWGKGAPFFSSSGNNSSSTISYPASNTNTIAVGASTPDDTRASFSNYGTGLDIVAPGENVYSTDIAGASGYSTNDYFYFSGTSAACPVAAGVMALILSADSSLTHTQARNIIETTCEKVGGYTYNTSVAGQPNGTWSTNNGYGRINAYQALIIAASVPPANDDISGASSLTATNTCNAISGNLAAATGSIPAPAACSNASSVMPKDVWYSFSATQSSMSIYSRGGTGTDVVLAAYSGSPAAPVLIACTNATGMGGNEVLHLTGLASSTTYFVQVFDANQNTFTTDFTICARTTPAITGNTTGTSHNVCAGSAANTLTGSQPAGGAGVLMLGSKVSSDFHNLVLSPGWGISLNQDTLIRGILALNSFGRTTTGSGVVFADNFNVAAGRRARIETNLFSPVTGTDTLRFDVAHAAYNANVDSLVVYAGNGTSFVRVAGWGSSQTVNTNTGITTANSQTQAFIPNSAQWTTKKLVLPAGSVQVRFELYSGYGNRLYLDNVTLDSSLSSYSFLWLKSATSATSGFSPAPGTNSAQSYSPGVLPQNSWFRRVVRSSGLSDTSAAVAVTVRATPNAGFTINNAEQHVSGNSFTFTDTTSGISSRSWNFGNNTTLNNTLSPVRSYTSAGIYQVKLRVSTSQGCLDSAINPVKVYPDVPTVAASSFYFYSVDTNSMYVGWYNGNGSGRILVVRAGAPVNVNPARGMSYNASSQFGSGHNLGSGNYVVYKGSGFDTQITGLSHSTVYYFALIELNGDSSLTAYQLPAYLTGSQATLLPVKWLGFEAAPNGDDVLLTWATASEQNNKGFTIEKRSSEHESWQTAGFVAGKGTSAAPASYRFNDRDALAGRAGIYYRLVQHDFDGNTSYSAIRYVSKEAARQPVAVYPNPTNGVFTITGTAEQAAIYDIFGKLVKTCAADTRMVDVRDLAKGIYIIEVTSGAERQRVKIVLE